MYHILCICRYRSRAERSIEAEERAKKIVSGMEDLKKIIAVNPTFGKKTKISKQSDLAEEGTVAGDVVVDEPRVTDWTKDIFAALAPVDM